MFIKSALFDFGGVIAEEGFLEGLYAIGAKNDIDPKGFFAAVDALIYETGYLIGKEKESVFWHAVRSRTGVAGSDELLRREILDRFVIRPDVLSCADMLRSRGIIVALLSDQTNWLDEINSKTSFFRHFDRIFNSYWIHKSKRDASLFIDVCSELRTRPEETLFVDDNSNHIERAQGQGLKTIHFTDEKNFLKQLQEYL